MRPFRQELAIALTLPVALLFMYLGFRLHEPAWGALTIGMGLLMLKLHRMVSTCAGADVRRTKLLGVNPSPVRRLMFLLHLNVTTGWHSQAAALKVGGTMALAIGTVQVFEYL
jgi:hypothetical protein